MTQPSAGPAPLRVALMNDYEVVVAGLRSMLAPYDDRVQVVELDCQQPVVSVVDVLLYDAFSRERVSGPVLEVVRESLAPVVVFTWHLEPSLVRESLALGVAGCVSKTVPALDLVEALEKVSAGSVVVSPDPGVGAEPAGGAWPGQDEGLSARESEILALIAQGLTNSEIAERAHVSANTVKTFIRSTYRKIGVERRSQAVLWATRHGFLPDVTRTVLVPGEANP